jgi:hypothetical protein
MRKTKEQTEMRTEIIGALKTPALESPEVRFFIRTPDFPAATRGQTQIENTGVKSREKRTQYECVVYNKL